MNRDRDHVALRLSHDFALFYHCIPFFTTTGTWILQIAVSGPAGPGEVEVPIAATAPPAIPDWTGWLIGLIPLYGVLVFLLTQRGRKEQPEQAMVVK